MLAGMRHTSLRCLVGAVLLLVPFARPADAQDAEPETVRPFLMPDLSGSGFAGVDAQLTFGEVDLGLLGSVDVTVVTVDAVAEVPVGRRLLVLGRLPLVYASRDEVLGDECCGASLGNLTAGARALFPLAAGGRDARIGAEVTVSLPTADDDGDGADGNGLAVIAQLPHDPGRYAPNATVVRAGGSGAVRAGRAFAQAELALHLAFYDDDAGEDSDSALRLGVGGGAQLTPGAAVLAELTTFANLDTDEGDEDFIHALDLGARWTGGNATASARIYFPLDEVFRDLDMFGLGLEAGARF